MHGICVRVPTEAIPVTRRFRSSRIPSVVAAGSRAWDRMLPKIRPVSSHVKRDLASVLAAGSCGSSADGWRPTVERARRALGFARPSQAL